MQSWHIETLTDLWSEGDCVVMLAGQRVPVEKDIVSLGPLVVNSIRKKHRYAPLLVALSMIRESSKNHESNVAEAGGEERWRRNLAEDYSRLVLDVLGRHVSREVDADALWHRHEYVRQLQSTPDIFIQRYDATAEGFRDFFGRTRATLDYRALSAFSDSFARATYFTRRLAGGKDTDAKELKSVVRSFRNGPHARKIVQQLTTNLAQLLIDEVDDALAAVRGQEFALLAPGQLEGDVHRTALDVVRQKALRHG